MEEGLVFLVAVYSFFPGCECRQLVIGVHAAFPLVQHMG